MLDRENSYDDLIWTAANQEAARAGVTPAFLVALGKAHIAAESKFTPTAYHWDGPDPVLNVSRGIFQIEGKTAAGLGLPTGADTDIITGPNAPRDYGTITVPGRTSGMYDVNLAIPTGFHIIATNLASTNGDVDKAIAAYNEGLGHAERDSYPYDNQDYVDAVNSYLTYFRGVTPEQAPPPSASTSGASPLIAIGGLALLGLGIAAFLKR